MDTHAECECHFHVRRENICSKTRSNYYRSNNPFADFQPDAAGDVSDKIATLTNHGLRSDVTYAKGIHNIKIGAKLFADIP